MLFVAEAVSTYYLLGRSISSLVGERYSLSTTLVKSKTLSLVMTDLIPWMSYCSLAGAPAGFGHFFVPILAFNTVILVLVLVKGFEVCFRSNDHSSILIKIYKDTFPYFIT